MLDIQNLVCKYKHVWSFRKQTLQLQDPLNYENVRITFVKSHHFSKNYIFIQRNNIRIN